MIQFGRIVGSTLALISCGAAQARPLPQDVDDAALLAAIAEKETGSKPREIGTHGERSQYQFTRDTWRLHSQLAFVWATDDPALAKQIAEQHLAYLRSVLRLQKHPQDAAHLAAAWHYGPRFAHLCVNTEYVTCVLNLYREALAK